MARDRQVAVGLREHPVAFARARGHGRAQAEGAHRHVGGGREAARRVGRRAPVSLGFACEVDGDGPVAGAQGDAVARAQDPAHRARAGDVDGDRDRHALGRDLALGLAHGAAVRVRVLDPHLEGAAGHQAQRLAARGVGVAAPDPLGTRLGPPVDSPEVERLPGHASDDRDRRHRREAQGSRSVGSGLHLHRHGHAGPRPGRVDRGHRVGVGRDVGEAEVAVGRRDLAREEPAPPSRTTWA